MLFAAACDETGDGDFCLLDIDALLVVGMPLQMTQRQPEGGNLDTGEWQYRPRAEGEKAKAMRRVTAAAESTRRRACNGPSARLGRAIHSCPQWFA